MTSPSWDTCRAWWPHTAQGVVWLQHAGISPPCSRVLDAALAAMQAFAQRPHTYYRTLWHAATDGAREQVAALLGTSPSRIALVKNTSQGILLTAQSLPWRAGDNVVTLAGEYPANRLPWRVVEQQGVALRTVEPDAAGRFPVDRLAAAIDAHTRVVAVSWVQYLHGFRVDLGALADLCARHDAFLVVDGVQGVGVLPLALDGVDALAVGGHKWLCGTEGAGFLYTSERLLDVATPRNVSWHSVATDLSVPGREVAVEPGLPPLKAGAERFEEGTPNTYGNVMLGAAATMLAELGVARVWDRVRGLLDELVERVRAKGYTVASSLAPDERSGIVALGHPAHDPDELVARLKAAGIVAIHRGAWLRLSPHFYNNSADLDRLCEVLP